MEWGIRELGKTPLDEVIEIPRRHHLERKQENIIVEPNELFAISVMTRKVAIAGRAYVVWVIVRKKR